MWKVQEHFVQGEKARCDNKAERAFLCLFEPRLDLGQYRDGLNEQAKAGTGKMNNKHLLKKIGLNDDPYNEGKPCI